MMIDNFTTTKDRTIKTVITRNMMKNKTKDWKPLKILITYKHFEVDAFREIRSVGKSLRVFWSLFIGPRIFSKLLKVPIALYRRLKIRLLMYLDDVLLMGETLEKHFMSRYLLIFLPDHLGFVKNLKKIGSETVPANKIFRPKNRGPHYEFGSSCRKR